MTDLFPFQHTFHQNLQQMRETARASILSLPGNGHSPGTTVEDDNVPILHSTTPKSSGLRRGMADDASFDYDDGWKKGGGRF